MCPVLARSRPVVQQGEGAQGTSRSSKGYCERTFGAGSHHHAGSMAHACVKRRGNGELALSMVCERSVQPRGLLGKEVLKRRYEMRREMRSQLMSRAVRVSTEEKNLARVRMRRHVRIFQGTESQGGKPRHGLVRAPRINNRTWGEGAHACAGNRVPNPVRRAASAGDD